MGQVARNALKGYTFQHYIFTLFLAKMDVERKIKRIESETIIKGNFDDLYIEEVENYRVQVKNYPGVTLADINISNRRVNIKRNSNEYNQEENNIVIINTDKIDTDTDFMGIPAIKVNDVFIIPLTPAGVQNLLDDMFSTEAREVQIIQFAFSLITSSNFVVNAEDLPKLIRMSIDLSDRTILIREPIDNIERGILWIYGKPGVGKSHYVSELISKYNDAIVYRFWTGSQDEHLMKRLQFDMFLKDIAVGVFNSPRSFTIEELVEEIVRQDKILIIDGIDHVENYNPRELKFYTDFFDYLKETRVVILSRPLAMKTNWKSMELDNWKYDETDLYLAMEHNITEYQVVKQIYEVANGYPIITFFLAEHYKIYKEFNITLEIENLNQYYSKLLEGVKLKSLLSIFATNNSFFTESEISSILKDSYMIEAIKEFIGAYPYLFKRILNRISLIHDSFNTYLRHDIKNYPDIKNKVNQFVQDSLLGGKVNFMARLTSFELSEEFYKEILLRYSQFDKLSIILESTLDYNSLTSFYNQLQNLLEQREDVLDIYHYYSFALISQMVNRNGLIGYDGLVYQLLRYMNNNLNIEEEIFSSGILWSTYITLKLQSESTYKKYLSDNRYDSNQIYELYETVNDEQCYFKVRKDTPDHKLTLEKLKDNSIYEFDKQDILIRHIIRVWTNQEQGDMLFEILDNYMNNDSSAAVKKLMKFIKEYDIDGRWSERILSSVKYQLSEIGELGESNLFYNKKLIEIINERAQNGSFEVAEYVKSFIRLANYEKRQIDIYSVNKLWIMYYNRKDYSVSTLDSSLIVFEKLGFVEEIKSIDVIKKVMNQSEKGIRNLLSNYINSKNELFIYNLEQMGMFDDNKFPIDIFNLMPEKINNLNIKYINKRMDELFSYHRYGKNIQYYDIQYPLQSKYSGLIIDMIDYYGYKIFGIVEDEEIEKMIIESGIEFIKDIKEKKEKYIPFDHGCIHESDKDYIIKNGIGYLEVSRYPDGWYSCLPFIDIYSFYNLDEIKEHYLKIIHNSMFARVSVREYIGDWNLLIGHIPEFLEKYNIDINWNKMYEVYKCFLRESLIYDLDENK